MKLAMFFLAVSLFFAFGAGLTHLEGGSLWIACAVAAVVMAIIGGFGMYFEGEDSTAASSALE